MKRNSARKRLPETLHPLRTAEAITALVSLVYSQKVRHEQERVHV